MPPFYYDQHILEYINSNRERILDPFLLNITNTAYLVAFLIPVFIFLYGQFKNSSTIKLKSLQIFISLVLDTIVVTIIKYSVNRQRPFVIDKHIEKLSSGGSPSFPSGHTADAFLIAACITILFNKNMWVPGLVWLWAFIVAYSRLALGVHYPSDILGGVIIGISNALFVNWIFLKRAIRQSTDV